MMRDKHDKRYTQPLLSHESSTKSRPGEGCAYSKGSAYFKSTIRLGALVVFKGTSNTGTPIELLF